MMTEKTELKSQRRQFGTRRFSAAALRFVRIGSACGTQALQCDTPGNCALARERVSECFVHWYGLCMRFSLAVCWDSLPRNNQYIRLGEYWTTDSSVFVCTTSTTEFSCLDRSVDLVGPELQESAWRKLWQDPRHRTLSCVPK